MTDEKSKNLDLAISQIEKQYGKGSIMRLGNRDVLVPVNVIPTGSISIDAALGVGGFPRGRVVEVYGPESGGKTTLTLHVIAEAQKLGGQAASRLGLSGPVWGWLKTANLNLLGFVIVGLFVATWAIALSVWRFGRIEQRWMARLQPPDVAGAMTRDNPPRS